MSDNYYQQRDWEFVDYHVYRLAETGLSFRGPQPLSIKPQQYFVCLGAAQTFGCFCERPYPNLLEKWFDLSVLNLAHGGAGPYFYLKHKNLFKYINQSQFAIIQVMSGRSESNTLLSSQGAEQLKLNSEDKLIGAEPAYQKILAEYEQSYVKMIIAETRLNWVQHFQTVLQQIKVPKILFWFSQRQPDYLESYENVYTLFNQFPHLVNAAMIEKIKPYCDAYVECISNRGMPQLLISRFTGEPTTINLAYQRQDLGDKTSFYNSYYFSPEMQREAATALKPVCQKYL
ncbi:MAG: DUF6473 family protein [Microcoleaceae cyanobacterium]